MKVQKNSNLNKKQIYNSIASQVRREIIQKYTPDFLYGKCIEASNRILELLKENCIDANIIEGWVQYDCSGSCSDRDYDEHTWVETHDGILIDVTATQFNNFMENDYPPIIVSDKLPYGFSYDKPLLKPLWEAKKRKNRSVKNKNKKLYKSLGWWPIYIPDEEDNCGNMEYNNNMFNKIMGNIEIDNASINTNNEIEGSGSIGASEMGSGGE